MEDIKVTISLEEYKELLIIKGRYEELKGSEYSFGKHQYKDYENWIFTPANYRAECSE